MTRAGPDPGPTLGRPCVDDEPLNEPRRALLLPRGVHKASLLATYRTSGTNVTARGIQIRLVAIRLSIRVATVAFMMISSGKRSLVTIARKTYWNPIRVYAHC